MEKAVHYGGDGMKLRSEYAPLSHERRAGVFIDASYSLEDLFERIDRTEGATLSVSTNSDFLERELSVEADEVEISEGDYIAADVATGEITHWQYLASRMSQKSIVARHHVYREGPKEEEYFLAVHRTLPNTKHSFFAIYEFEWYKGGVVHATVQMNDVTLDGGDEGSMLCREMTEYDVELFNKDIAEIVAYVNGANNEARMARSFGSFDGAY